MGMIPREKIVPVCKKFIVIHFEEEIESKIVKKKTFSFFEPINVHC